MLDAPSCVFFNASIELCLNNYNVIFSKVPKASPQSTGALYILPPSSQGNLPSGQNITKGKFSSHCWGQVFPQSAKLAKWQVENFIYLPRNSTFSDKHVSSRFPALKRVIIRPNLHMSENILAGPLSNSHPTLGKQIIPLLSYHRFLSKTIGSIIQPLFHAIDTW